MDKEELELEWLPGGAEGPFLPGESVELRLRLRVRAACRVSVLGGRYAASADGARSEWVEAELMPEAELAPGAAVELPLSFSVPQLPAHVLRGLSWTVYAEARGEMGSLLRAERAFAVQTAGEQLRQGQGGRPGLRLAALREQAGLLITRLFLSVFALGGGMAAFGALFQPYWAANPHVAGVRWFAALAALGGLALGRKIWESPDPARHGQHAAARVFALLYALGGLLCLYVWAWQPGWLFLAPRFAPERLHALAELPAATRAGGHLLVPLVLGCLLLSLSGFALAPRAVGTSAVFTLPATLLAALVTASGLAGLALRAPGWQTPLALALLGGSGFAYLCWRPDWANKPLRFVLPGLLPLALAALAEGLLLLAPEGLFPRESLLAGLGALLLLGGLMAYIANRNRLAAWQTGLIRASLLREATAPGQPVELRLHLRPRRDTRLAGCLLEVSCWRSDRRSGNDESRTWRDWQRNVRLGPASLPAGQDWEQSLRLVLPIDARPSESGSNATWWEVWLRIEIAGRSDWSQQFPLTVRRGA